MMIKLLVIALVAHLTFAAFPDRDVIELHTPSQLIASYNYYIKTNNNFFTFQVKAKTDAIIGLFCKVNNILPTIPTYEIIIGGFLNTKSVIKKNGIIKASKISPILKPNDFIEMWCRFSNGIVSIGLVDQESVPFIKYEDSNLANITHISVVTAAGSTGEWVLSIPQFNFGDVLGPVDNIDTCSSQ